MTEQQRDGIDHINIYSKGATELGHFLSNFSNSPFICQDGRFNSIEGYWYWLNSNKDESCNILRTLSGFKAKEIGKTLLKEDRESDPNFQDKIKTAIRNKILSNNYFKEELIKSTLPLKHYYSYGGKLVELPQYQWIVDHIETIRSALKRLSYIKGDLFKDIKPGSFLGHSCNTNGNWGAGIAKTFKDKYPDAYKEQKLGCEEYGQSILGKCFVTNDIGVNIISLFTSKGYGTNKSPVSDILANTGKSISMFFDNYPNETLKLPQINAGLFKVPWESTEKILIRVLERYPEAKITIYVKR